MRQILALVVLLLSGLVAAHAGDGFPLQIGIYPPVQLVPEHISVRGLRLNLPLSENDHLVGLDLGLASRSGDTEALQVNVYNMVYGEMTGLQAGLLNTVGSGNGLQLGLLNHVNTVFSGIQVSLINIANEVTGSQIGVINRAQYLTGLQIGLVNVIDESAVPFFPIINMAF